LQIAEVSFVVINHVSGMGSNVAEGIAQHLREGSIVNVKVTAAVTLLTTRAKG
jgi:hypothetical protein